MACSSWARVFKSKLVWFLKKTFLPICIVVDRGVIKNNLNESLKHCQSCPCLFLSSSLASSDLQLVVSLSRSARWWSATRWLARVTRSLFMIMMMMMMMAEDFNEEEEEEAFN